MKHIYNPLTGKKAEITCVLASLAGQEGCDEDPYEQMVEAAEYINELEELNQATVFNSNELMFSVDDLKVKNRKLERMNEYLSVISAALVIACACLAVFALRSIT